MDAYLAGLEDAEGRRHRPVHDPLRRVVLRLPRRHRGRQAARRDRHRRGRRAARRGRRRQRPPGLRRLRGGLRHRPVRRARGRRRPTAAAAVGLDRASRTRALPRHHVRHRPRRRRHRQHDAREDHGGLRRPRRGRGRPRYRQAPPRPRQCSTGSTDVGIDFDDVLRVLEREGVEKFEKSWHELVETIQGQLEKARAVTGGHAPGGHRLEHRRRDERRSSCSSAIATRRPSPPRSSSWWPTGSPAGMAAKDPTLWGAAAEEEAAKRLGWVDLSESSRPLVAEIAALRGELTAPGLTRVVLCGMGGSSLAPEVICGAAGVELDVLDSSDPDFVRTALERRPRATPSSSSRRKSGGTVETDSQRRAYEKAFTDAGIDAARADHRGHRPGLAARPVGHRGRLPRLPRRPERRRAVLRADRLRPGAQRAGRRRHRRAAGRGRGDPPAPRGGLRRQPRPAPRRPARRGQPGRRRQAGAVQRRRPVRRVRRLGRAARSPSRPARTARASCRSSSSRRPPRTSPPAAPTRCSATFGPGWLFDDVRTKSGLGRSAWTPRWARRCCCGSTPPRSPARIIGINPFDQPDVESAKAAAREHARRRRRPSRRRASPTAPVTVYASPGWLSDDVDTVHDAIAELLGRARPRAGYVAVQAYLDRHRDAALADVRDDHRVRHRAARHLRLGPAVPALHRAVPQGRTVHRRLPPGDRPARARPRRARPAVHLPRVPDRPGRRRRAGARREGPARAAAAPRRPGPTWTPYGRRSRESCRLDQPAAGPARTGGCPGSPGRAGWCSSASPATCRARR